MSLSSFANVMLAASVVTMIVAEVVIRLVRRRSVAWADSVTSATIGLGYLAIRIAASHTAAFAFYVWVYRNLRVFDLSWRSPAVWLGFWLVGDFVYYWVHRAEHRVRILWCTHLVHHSSEDFSFTTAVRMPWTDILYKPITGLWAPLLGFPPVLYPVAGAVSLMLGQLQHTDLIGRLGVLDRLFVTPSNHRVHHASNRRYIDRNFGGSSVVWDRLFRTYEPETETPRYGLVHPLAARTPWGISAGGYPSLLRDVRATPGLRARVALCVGAPQ
jgi:alkylglycerol monooxygenase